MKLRLAIFMVFALVIFLYAQSAFSEDPKGTSYSRPNVSGGSDFYDSTGKKTGSSSKKYGGGFDYYDQRGNKTGSLRTTQRDGTFSYYDADNVRRGEFTDNPYGGYRYYEKKEGVQTAEQNQIRRDHQYKNPYGSGIDTLDPDVIRGRK